MAKASEVFKKIRFAKLDKQHDKAGPFSTDDEEHGAVSEIEWNQQLKHQKHRAMQEEEQLDEKNAPTNPSLWSRAKALARSKFDVYPSAYANGWASKWYKSKGGGWKTVSEGNDMKSARIIKDLYKKKGVTKEEVERVEEGAFKRMATDTEEDKRLGSWKKETPWMKSKGTVTDKSGAKHTPMSTARDLARKAAQKNVKESVSITESRIADIVREAAEKAKKKKKEETKKSDDTFQAEPELSSQIIRND